MPTERCDGLTKWISEADCSDCINCPGFHVGHMQDVGLTSINNAGMIVPHREQENCATGGSRKRRSVGGSQTKVTENCSQVLYDAIKKLNIVIGVSYLVFETASVYNMAVGPVHA